MLEYIAGLVSALYAAFTAFAVAVQALAPVLPWHASIALSGALAAIAAVGAWAFYRIFRRT